MTNTQLIDSIEKDLANVNATKSAHIQIVNILNAYRQKVQAEEKKTEPKKESKK